MYLHQRPSSGTVPCPAAVLPQCSKSHLQGVREHRSQQSTRTQARTHSLASRSLAKQLAGIRCHCLCSWYKVQDSIFIYCTAQQPIVARCQPAFSVLHWPIHLRHPISRFRGAKQVGSFVGSRRACLVPIKPAIHAAATRSSILLPSTICHSPRQLELDTICNG